MKTLKITLALAAVLMLTVSGVKSEDVVASTTEKTEINQPTKIDLLAHTKKEIKMPSQG